MLCGDDTESLEHVLLTCRSPERTTIWRTTADIWPVTTFGPWPDVTISTILGCGSLSLKPQQAEIGPSRNPTNRNTSQLLHILISEAAHLIWVLRCEHVIGGKTTTPQAIESQWLHKMNHRLQIDRHPTRNTKRSLASRHNTKGTWQHIMSPPNVSNDKWLATNEVLVGIILPRPSVEQGNQVVTGAPHPLQTAGRA
jgi:hypothetical protein